MVVLGVDGADGVVVGADGVVVGAELQMGWCQGKHTIRMDKPAQAGLPIDGRRSTFDTSAAEEV